MSSYLQFIILSALTGNPLVALLLMLAIGWLLERYTLGFLPGPVRLVRRFLRVGKLKTQLLHNPHDRKARFELAELMLGRRQYRRALELLRPNLEAGEHDAETLLMTGIACYGSGHPDQGELFFSQAEEEDPNFRLGQVNLERGRWRLSRGDAKGAREALEKVIAVRTGTVEGRVLLSRALAKLDDPTYVKVREQAWHEYATAPRFQQRQERLWAWRAKPSRPIAYAVLLVLCGVLVKTYVVPRLPNRNALAMYGAGDFYGDEEDEADDDANANGPASVEPATDLQRIPDGWHGWRVGSVQFALPSRFQPRTADPRSGAARLSDGSAETSLKTAAVQEDYCSEFSRNSPRALANPSTQAVSIGGKDAIGMQTVRRGSPLAVYFFCHAASFYTLSLKGNSLSREEQTQFFASVQFDVR